MSELSEVAAIVNNGVVVNVAALSSKVDFSAWLIAMQTKHDEVRVVSVAGIGWTVEEDGLRPPTPYASWTWNGSEWVAPMLMPDDDQMYQWNEKTQEWQQIKVL